jgi:hypothetical protein
MKADATMFKKPRNFGRKTLRTEWVADATANSDSDESECMEDGDMIPMGPIRRNVKRWDLPQRTAIQAFERQLSLRTDGYLPTLGADFVCYLEEHPNVGWTNTAARGRVVRAGGSRGRTGGEHVD